MNAERSMLLAAVPSSAIRRATRRLALLLAIPSIAAANVASASPLEPPAALADFQLPPGFRIELAAAEPEVVDPIAIAFDEEGRLWVVEMRNYPALPAGAEPTSRIRVLHDRDGDGRYESAATFAEELLFPTGLQPWRGGVIVTLAGEIAYFPDDDRDDRADRKETWYQGFATGNEQLRANHPQLAADGLVYVAGGLRGGTIRNLRRPAAPAISINGRDFAFDPVSGQCWAVSGNGQFGLAFDDFGRRFTCSNRNPLMQVIIEQRYLERNPALVLPTVVHDVAAAGAASRLFPRTRALTTSLEHAGQFTAACGVEIARGDALSQQAYGHAFICEPTANLVHREALSASGAALTSRPVETGSEFLSATDEWFRPVNLCTGPDGALYVVDMYRAVIEHPEWMPEEWRDRPDMRAGADRGRIYRIVADDAQRRPSRSHEIQSRPPCELAPLLDHPNSWHRETAARLLLEGNGVESRDALAAMAHSARDPVGRYHALAALGMLEVLSNSVLLRTLDDESPGVRALALAHAERRVAKSPKLAVKLLSMVGDDDPRVRQQLALSLMSLPADKTTAALQSILLQGSGDEWTRRAVALSARGEARALLAGLVPRQDGPRQSQFAMAHLQELVDAVVAAGGAEQSAAVLAHAESLDPAEIEELLLLVDQSLATQRRSSEEALRALASLDPPAYQAVQRVMARALSTIADSNATDAERIEAARVLKLDFSAQPVAPLLSVIRQLATPAVQIAAVDALRDRPDAAIAPALIDSFQSHLPSARQAILEVLMASPEHSIALLQAVAEERITIADVGATRAQQLLQHVDPEVRELARQTLGSHSEDRAAVVAEYQPALQLTGDAARGKQVFLAACAACHRVAGEGTAIGPDIGDSAMKPAAQLLTDILDPNRAVDANYVSYTALTVNGLAYQGVIRSETDSGLSLQTAEGKTVSLLREELESLTGGGSLMPEGLEREVSPPQMADLLAFLKMWRQGEQGPIATPTAAERRFKPAP